MKKILIAFAVILMAVVLNGCGEDIREKINSDMGARGALNIQEVGKLVKAGILEEDAAKLIIDDINSKIEYAKDLEKYEEQLKPYISWHIRGSVSSGKLTYKTVVSDSFNLEDTKISIDDIHGVENPDVKALNIVGGDYIEDFQKKLNNTIMEINISKDVALDEVVTAIKNAKNAKASGDTSKMAEAFNTLNTYFKDSGKVLVTEPLIRTTTLGAMQGYSYYNKEGDIIDNITVPQCGDGVNLMLGLDFRIRGEIGLSEITIRLEEFNPEAIARLIGMDGVAVDEYLTYNGTIYKLTCPINYVDAVSLDPNNSDNFITTTTKTDYNINLLTGEITDKDGYPLNQNGSELIKIGGSGLQGEVGQSSFIISKDKVVLRDYLELSYMPDIVDGEKWVALGRRFRIHKLTGSTTGIFASVIDNNGNIDSFTARVYVTDLMGVMSDHDGYDNYNGKAIKLGDNTSEESETEEEESQSVIDQEHETKLLEPTYTNYLIPFTKFGNGFIAKNDTDAGTNGKMFFYGMCIDKSPFKNGLYESWITGGDSKFGNLTWWNSWLNTNNYAYQIDANKLNGFLMDNYKFELRQEGYIILDTDVIAKIQQNYNNMDKNSRINGIRTLFIILGILLIAYALVLIASWTFDVNIVTGPRLMQTITFNKWEAIQNDKELPRMEVGEKHYMTFSKTLTSSIMIMVVGLLLVIVDVVALVSGLIDIFGGVAELIFKALFGRQ